MVTLLLYLLYYDVVLRYERHTPIMTLHRGAPRAHTHYMPIGLDPYGISLAHGSSLVFRVPHSKRRPYPYVIPLFSPLEKVAYIALL